MAHLSLTFGGPSQLISKNGRNRVYPSVSSPFPVDGICRHLVVLILAILTGAKTKSPSRFISISLVAKEGRHLKTVCPPFVFNLW